MLTKYKCFRYMIVCRPMYQRNGAIGMLRFQLVVPEEQKKGNVEYRGNDKWYQYRYERPMGTFELMMTNGTKFERIYDSRQYGESDQSKFSISSAPDIFFDVVDIVDQVSLYLHTTILVKQHD